MADVPSTKRRLQGVMEMIKRMRDQGAPPLPPATTREERFLLPGISLEEFKEFQRRFVPKQSDLFVASYPKCGTTWVQHIVSLIKNNGVDDGEDLDDKWLWCEQFTAAEVEQFSASRSGGALFKSHLPYTLLPGLTVDSPAKYIYVYRNPKDAVVSYYYHMQSMRGPVAWEEYFDLYLEGGVHLGSIFEHHAEWWEHKDDPNVLFICYEEMKADLKKCIKMIASFLGHDLTDGDLLKIAELCTFTAMKQNNAVNKVSLKVFDKHFIRKGIVGDWRNHLSADQSAKMDKVVAEKITGIGLVYQYGPEQ